MPKSSQKSSLSFYTKPWFVLALVFGCFAILTPKIFLPLFRQMLGLNSDSSNNQNNINNNNNNNNNNNQYDRFQPPNMRPQSERRGGLHQYPRPGPQSYVPQPSGPSSKNSFLTFLLPVYAIGIGLYMVYTLFKVFNKDKNSEDEEAEDESDFEPVKAKTMKFKERNYGPNLNWDGSSGEFKFRSNHHFARSEESEDEYNDYESYKNLDPDYVDYLKKLRRAKREEARKSALNSKAASPIDEDIPVSPNIGLTSITNTNVLMNETLERMKHSLNKINMQLTHAEKKGGNIEDPDLEDLRTQLSQTEQQMLKIYNIVNTVSNSLQNSNIVLDEDIQEDLIRKKINTSSQPINQLSSSSLSLNSDDSKQNSRSSSICNQKQKIKNQQNRLKEISLNTKLESKLKNTDRASMATAGVEQVKKNKKKKNKKNKTK